MCVYVQLHRVTLKEHVMKVHMLYKCLQVVCHIYGVYLIAEEGVSEMNTLFLAS